MSSYAYIFARRRVKTLEDIDTVRSNWLKETQLVGLMAGLVLGTFLSTREFLTKEIAILLVDIAIVIALLCAINSILITVFALQVKSEEFLHLLKLNYSPPLLYLMPHFYAIVSFLMLLISWGVEELLRLLEIESQATVTMHIIRLVILGLALILTIVSMVLRDRARLMCLNLEEDDIFGHLSWFKKRGALSRLNKTKYTRNELTKLLESLHEQQQRQQQNAIALPQE